MEPHPTPARTGDPAVRARDARPRPAAVRAALATVLLTGLLTGCGVRLEAPPVAEPVPDALEVVRRTAVSDALGVADAAETALEEVPADREGVVSELTRIAAHSRTQAEALGGEYDSGLVTDEPTSAAHSTAADGGTPADVVEALDDAAARSRTAAGSTADGPLARLLASVGAAQTVSAGRLGALTDTDGPAPVDPQVPAPTAAGAAAERPSSASPSASADGSGSGDGDDVAPVGLTAEELDALVLSEDAARYALRQRAAITTDEDRRARLLDRVAAHAERAPGWAAFAGTQDTSADPRRVAYAVPTVREQKDATLVVALERDLATDYATLVGTTVAGTRGVLVDLLVDSTVALDDWGADPVPFPGLPEQAEDEASADD